MGRLATTREGTAVGSFAADDRDRGHLLALAGFKASGTDEYPLWDHSGRYDIYDTRAASLYT